MPAHHKHRTLLLEAEPDDQSNPTSFLARCRAIVEEITTPVVKSVPLVIRHRVHDLRPRARACYLRRRVMLYVPKWNETSAKKLEKILGFILILVAGLLLKPDDANPVKESAAVPLSSYLIESSPATTTGDLSTVEVPWLADTAVHPALLQQMAPQSNQHPYSRFHSYANPKTRFTFTNEVQNNNLTSTHAACGMAQHFQHSMPVMIRKGSRPVWQSHPVTQSVIDSKQIGNHPLHSRMMRQAHQQAFQHYINNGTYNASAIPMMKVAHQYHSLSQVLKQSCGTANEDNGSEE